jgi:hypothetical protein
MKQFIAEFFAATLLLCATAMAAQEQAAFPPQDGPARVALTPLFDAAELHTPSLYTTVNTLKYHNPSFDFIQTPTPPKTSKTPEKIKRAPVDPSMVGYIDNAIVHTEVRVRFDAALHNDTPDRAEFFYAKCGCYRITPPTPQANYDPNSPGPGPGVPNYVNFQQLYFNGEYAINPRFSLFAQVPIRWLQPHPSGSTQAFTNNSGVSDLQIGFKLAVIASPNTYLTIQFRANLPSGDAIKGLGTNHIAAEPALLYFHRVSDRLSVEGQLMGTLPLSSSLGKIPTSLNGFAGNVFTYGVGPSYLLMNHENFRLAGVIELVGWNVTGGDVTNRTSTNGVNIVNLKVGPRMSFGSHQSFYFGYGIALTSQTWYREIFRTEYRYTF